LSLSSETTATSRQPCPCPSEREGAQKLGAQKGRCRKGNVPAVDPKRRRAPTTVAWVHRNGATFTATTLALAQLTQAPPRHTGLRAEAAHAAAARGARMIRFDGFRFRRGSARGGSPTGLAAAGEGRRGGGRHGRATHLPEGNENVPDNDLSISLSLKPALLNSTTICSTRSRRESLLRA